MTWLWSFISDATQTLSDGLAITDVPNDPPEFKRVYKKQLDSRASIEITIKQFLDSLMTSGELDQPDGRWVLFEPERPADKILDPTLLPLVNDAVGEIMRIDREFRSKPPATYTDTGGVKWTRAVG